MFIKTQRVERMSCFRTSRVKKRKMIRRNKSRLTYSLKQARDHDLKLSWYLYVLECRAQEKRWKRAAKRFGVTEYWQHAFFDDELGSLIVPQWIAVCNRTRYGSTTRSYQSVSELPPCELNIGIARGQLEVI